MRDRHALMSQKTAETVKVKAVLQLLVREGVSASVRGHSDFGIDADSIRRLFHENADCLFCQAFPVFAEKNIIVFTAPGCKVFFSCAQILVKEFADRRVFRHDTFFPAFAVDHKISVLDLVELHSRQFAEPDSGVKENHQDHFVSQTDVIRTVVVFYHPSDLFAVEGVDQHFRLFHVLHSLGENVFTVPFSLRVGAQTLDGFEKIVDVRGFASPVLQRTDVLLDMDGFQLFKLNYLKVFPNKMPEFVELFFVVGACQIRQFPYLAIKEEFVYQLSHKHRNAPFRLRTFKRKRALEQRFSKIE